MISSDPFEQELDAEVQDLAREAKWLGREVRIARMKKNIAEIKHESTQQIDESLVSENAVKYIEDPEDIIVEAKR